MASTISQEWKFVESIARGDMAECKELLRKDPSLITKTQKKDIAAQAPTIVHTAASRGHVDILALLLDHGGKPDAVNSNGDTPLHLV